MENMPKRILLVEDDLFIRDLYVRTLEQNGYIVEIAIDGEEGVNKALANTPDIMLLDIMMPEKNGIEVLKEIKGNDKTKGIPVFLLTNLGQEGIIKEAFNIGASGYLLKARMLPRDVAAHINSYFETGKVPSELMQA